MASKSFSDNLVPYLRQVDTTFRNKFETDDMKKLFLDNVFDEIMGRELNLIVRKATSGIMENLVASASAENTFQLLKVCDAEHGCILVCIWCMAALINVFVRIFVWTFILCENQITCICSLCENQITCICSLC